MSFTQDFRTQRRNYNDGTTRIGEKDRLWYDSNTNSIRISDGITPGGVIVGGAGGGGNYVLPTATTTVKGGVKIDGTTITIANEVISVGTVPYSSLSGTPTIPTNTNQLTNGAGFISNYTETDPVFVAHAAYNITNTKISNWDTAYGWGNHANAGYLTSVGTISSLTNGPDTLSLNGANKVDLPGGTAYIFSAANNITLSADLTGSNYLEIINNVGAEISTDKDFDIKTNTDATTRTWSFTQGGSLFFPDSTFQTTAYSTNAARALFSATNASASGSGGSLSYSNGVYTFTPALNIAGNAATVTNGVYTTDTGTVTNTMLAGSIANNKLANSSITINSTAVSLGGTITGIVTTGDTGTVTNTMLAGSIDNAKLTNSSITVNGTSIALGASGTVTAAAGTLTGTILNSTVVTSSLTSVGTLTNLTVSGSATVVSNSATDKYINVGTRGQLFDDGNFHIHANSGALWLNSLDSSNIKIGTQYNTGTGSDVDIGKNLIVNSGSVTANAATAFIAGSSAVSGVALQVPQEGAIRNLYNGANNMYFDVSIGGSTNGSFQFRSSSSYTNVLTMSPTAVSFNTGAAVTARTPALARTSFNAAIDTELTVNDLRFRVSNQGGIFPQVISNTGGSKNLAWTGVGAISGSAIAQVGSTGTIVAHNAWTTLFNAHGMDSAGDTVTVTLQDKAEGIIYRITFMRSDNGSTTGYNIIGERIL